MTVEGVRTKLGYRICDWVGNTIIEPLPHMHQSTWTINGFQSGAPGSTTIGNFTIPLYPPVSKEYHLYKGIYSLIQYGLRIEGYVLDEAGEYMPTTPVFSGIITKISKLLESYQIEGFDTLWLAEQNVFYPGQTFVGTGNDILQGITDIEFLTLLDDFSGHQYPSGITYTTAIGTPWTHNAVDEGLTGLSIAAPSSEAITVFAGPGTFPTSLFLDLSNLSQEDSVVISGWFHIPAPSIANGDLIGAEMLIGSDLAGQNGILCRAEIGGTGTNYNISADIFKKVSGSYTSLVSKSAFTALTGDAQIQLTIIVSGTNVTVVVNGNDTQCTATTTGLIAGGYTGIRAVANGANVGKTIFFSFPYIKERVVNTAFNINAIANCFNSAGQGGLTGQFNMSLNLSGLTMLDLWAIGATAEGWVFRKYPFRMGSSQEAPPPSIGGVFIGDLIVWGFQGTFLDPLAAGAGINLINQIILEEGREVISGGQNPNSESLGTELKFGFSASASGSGNITWPDPLGLTVLARIPGNPNSPPLIITDVANITGVGDFLAARRMAQSLGAHKSLAGQAKTFTILRTPEIAQTRLDLFNSEAFDFIDANTFYALNPHAFAEQDLITLNVPSLDINMVQVSVMAYTFREDDPTMDITLDQHPNLSKNIIDRRRWGVLDTFLLKQGG